METDINLTPNSSQTIELPYTDSQLELIGESIQNSYHKKKIKPQFYDNNNKKKLCTKRKGLLDPFDELFNETITGKRKKRKLKVGNTLVSLEFIKKRENTNFVVENPTRLSKTHKALQTNRDDKISAIEKLRLFRPHEEMQGGEVDDILFTPIPSLRLKRATSHSSTSNHFPPSPQFSNSIQDSPFELVSSFLNSSNDL